MLVAYDHYELNATIALRSGVDVYGGCATMARPDPASVSLVTAPRGGEPAFHARDLADPTTVQGFAVLATPAVTPGSASIAFRAQNTNALTLSHLVLSAANGATGGHGLNGDAGKDGGDAGGPPEAGTNRSCQDANGGVGGTQKTWFAPGCRFDGTAATPGNAGSTGVSAPPGAMGHHVCYGCPKASRPGSGSPGEPGRSGVCGAGGVASDDIAGRIVLGAWVPSHGGNGSSGGSGGGGAGGGAGGGCGYTGCWGGKSAYNGMEGGGGGAGGCGGLAGLGGMQGGASIALLLDGGTVVIRHSTIVGAAGGRGGAGGNGGAGGRGGSGKSSPSANPCNARGGSGGTGGKGGMGGSGGGGAGGNGGPAIGIAETRGSNVEIDVATKFYAGIGGPGGRGGSNPVSHCRAIQPSDGMTGLAANRMTF